MTTTASENMGVDFASRRRVKVYALSQAGTWEDLGTGHVTCKFIEVGVGKLLLFT